MKKTTFAALGAFALLVVSAPAQAEQQTAASPAKGAIIEYRGVPNTFVIEIRENPAAAQTIAAEEAAIEETAAVPSAPAPVAFQPQTRQRMSLWEQLTGKGRQPEATLAPAASVEAAETYAAPVAAAPAAIEAQGDAAQEAPLQLWEKLAIEQPNVR